MFSHMDLYMHVLWSRDGFTRKYLCAGVFAQGCFYTKKLLRTDAWVLVQTDAFTQRCFYRGVILHARAFTQGFF